MIDAIFQKIMTETHKNRRTHPDDNIIEVITHHKYLFTGGSGGTVVGVRHSGPVKGGRGPCA